MGNHDSYSDSLAGRWATHSRMIPAGATTHATGKRLGKPADKTRELHGASVHAGRSLMD